MVSESEWIFVLYKCYKIVFFQKCYFCSVIINNEKIPFIQGQELTVGSYQQMF